MEDRKNEGGRRQREGCTVGLTPDRFEPASAPIFQPQASRGDFIGVCVCECVSLFVCHKTK